MSKDKNYLELDLDVASDNGNSQHKIIINNGTIICNPNVCAKKRELPNLEFQNIEYIINNIEHNLFADISSSNIEDTGRYYIGESALKCGEYVRSVEVGVDNSKIDTDIIPINILGEIGGYCIKKSYENNKNFYKDIKKIVATVRLATSLPLNQFNKNNINIFKNKLIGNHIISMYVASEYISVEINIISCAIIGEGITTAWGLRSLDDTFFIEYNKKYKEKYTKTNFKDLNSSQIKSKKLLHIAIGEGTTEYPVTKDIEFDVNFIKGTSNGIGIAINKALDKFKKDINLPEFSRQSFSEILKNKKDKYYNIAYDDVEEYINDQSNAILEVAKNELRKANNDIDIILVYGGGSIFMRKYLEPKLEALCTKTQHTTLLYVSEDYSVTIEVLGLNNFIHNKMFDILTK